MNFFGHAAVASWQDLDDDRGAYVLGAMLPDFQSIAGVRPTAIASPALERGIALHHHTDGVFHPLPVVVGLMRELFDRLTAAGVSRGPARAASHAGMEMMLDGVLVDAAAHREAYLEALAVEPVPATFAPPERIAHVMARLRAHGVPYDLQRADAITTRLVRMVADRPLLATRGDEPAKIKAALAAFRTRIEVAAPTVVMALRAAL